MKIKLTTAYKSAGGMHEPGATIDVDEAFFAKYPGIGVPTTKANREKFGFTEAGEKIVEPEPEPPEDLDDDDELDDDEEDEDD